MMGAMDSQRSDPDGDIDNAGCTINIEYVKEETKIFLAIRPFFYVPAAYVHLLMADSSSATCTATL